MAARERVGLGYVAHTLLLGFHRASAISPAIVSVCAGPRRDLLPGFKRSSSLKIRHDVWVSGEFCHSGVKDVRAIGRVHEEKRVGCPASSAL